MKKLSLLLLSLIAMGSGYAQDHTQKDQLSESFISFLNSFMPKDWCKDCSSEEIITALASIEETELKRKLSRSLESIKNQVNSKNISLSVGKKTKLMV